MSLDALALAVQLPGFSGTTLAPEVAALLGEGLGGICLFGANVGANVGAHGGGSLRDLTDAVHAAGPGAIVAVDEEGGDVTRLHPDEGSPVLGAAALGQVGDLALTRRTARAVGVELAAAGVDLDLAPVADVNSNPDNPVIGTRSFGPRPQPVAAHVVAWTTGLQEAGVAACVKHFPGHGDTAQDSHVALPVLDRDRAQLAARELVPFAAAVDAGVAAIMTSHILVPAIDPYLPATLSRPVLTLLRDRLRFDGVVVSDALDMAGASAGRGIPEAAVLALAAGADLLCLGADKDVALVREVQAAIVAAVDSGRLEQARLEDAVRRIAALRGRVRPEPMAVGELADARLSLVLDGTLPPLAGARVVTVETPATIAVGDVPWGLPADVSVTPDDYDAWRAAADGSPLVLQVRDLHRQPWARCVVDHVAERAGVPVVVVEWGWPGPWESGLPRIRTHGWSRPGAVAVTELLREAGWDR
ncbi:MULTISPECIES: glycoside hydrolase family 3 N-terminal domain-containing protein [unclassified Nocardioides]|uniref:glycoside hydrolase family 3 N-terminal domain-containing protein n=1 Tax=unclassified Nocardioides TaxID=2615069 RepID=UPI0030142A17